MNDARFEIDDTRSAMPPPAGDELLPPVEPPSAGFIIQLFVVPALIVLVIVGVWLSFSWLVRRTTTRPQDLIQGMEDGSGVARWQRASELADLLRNERFADFKRNGEAAAHLARILDREIANSGSGAGMDEGSVTLRYFLARALGEFEVQEGMDVLVKAAETDRDPKEQIVRHGALEAIAVRAFNLRHLDPPQEIELPQLEEAMLHLAEDDDLLLRSQTAYTLGQLGTPAAMARLEVMTDDPDADTRYNAAVALAHAGNTRSVETLAEMLDLEELATRREDDREPIRARNAGMIVHTAIEAAKALAEQDPGADLAAVIEALEKLQSADPKTLAAAHLPLRAAAQARDALKAIDRMRAREATP
jgi:hypothetical protein